MPTPPTRLAAALFATILIARGSGPAQARPQPPKPSAVVAAPSSLPENRSTGRGEGSVEAAAAEQPPAQRFQVDYTVGKVAIDATNASLNQVVREVARKASIKVTGTVADERVFGHYGPASPSVVLAALLDGTGSNMLLVSDAEGASELVLTPRRGTTTPPNPNAAAQEDSNADASEDGPAPQYVAPSRTFQPPSATGRGPVNANQDGSPSSEPASAPSDESDETAPQGNGQRTPQQIYEQLQKMMQQRQSTTPAPAPEPPDQ